MASVQRTLVLLKPDAVQRELLGQLLSRFERKGLKTIGLKFIHLSDALLDEHYAHLKAKAFFPGLKKFMMQTPVVAMVLEGLDVIDCVRKVVGSTNPREAEAGSIRADFSMNVPSNLVHASDSVEAAEAEIKRFFKAEELFTYTKLTDLFHFGEGI